MTDGSAHVFSREASSAAWTGHVRSPIIARLDINGMVRNCRGNADDTAFSRHFPLMGTTAYIGSKSQFWKLL